MDITSPEFLILFGIAIIIVTMRARSKRKNVRLPEKRISVKGERINTPLSLNTPLVCLLADDTKYGEDFRDKQPPELPHTESCACQLTPVLRQHQQMFDKSKPSRQTHESDLGGLTHDQARYYKYALIAHHPDATDQQKTDFSDLFRQVPVDEPFKTSVEDHFISDTSFNN